MNGQRTVAVLGARQHSLGAAVVDALPVGWQAKTIGMSGEEEYHLSLLEEPGTLRVILQRLAPEAIICTVGTNQPAGIGAGNFSKTMLDSYATNVIAPMLALKMAMGVGSVKQFAAVSSNSAQIARRGSIPYCASKAALSMAIRVAAREMAGGDLLVYGYEFGLLQGTPMTMEVAERFEGPLTRIPGAPSGLSTQSAARAIVANLLNPWQGLNGTLLRYDGGEQ